jgi:outer membrane protein insertion porin family
MTLQQYKVFAFLTISFCSYVVSAQKQTSYKVIGNETIDTQVFIDCLRENSTKKTSVIKDAVGKKLNAKGYYNYEIVNLDIDTSSSKDTTSFLLNITEGSQSLIRNVFIDSLGRIDSTDILSFFSFLEGEIFIETELEERIENALIRLENSGYPFASFIVKSLVFVNDEDSNYVVDIFLGLEKEKVRKIDKVEISGNTKTDERVIINSTRLVQGEKYSQKKIDEIPIQLNKLRFFQKVTTPKYFVNSNNEGILHIDIVEKNTNSFDGILGYVPSIQNGESGYLTGFINISLRNLFGSGRGLSFKWQQENSLTQDIELKYLEPWILNQPFNLNLQFFQRKQDSSYVKRIIGGSLEYLATENISASFILESESIIPSINSNLSIPNSSSFNSGIQLKLDYRDDIYSPQNGTYFSSTYKFRTKSIDNGEAVSNSITESDLEYHNYELDFGLFYSIFQNQVIALGVHAKEIIGDYYEISDFFHLGGTNSLRGYRENQFLGNRIIWSNTEYRFLMSQSSYLFAFYDAGYYLINENISNNISRQSGLKTGYGFGISLDTNLGIMRVSYAIAEGSSITNGLIHFGLLNDF